MIFARPRASSLVPAAPAGACARALASGSASATSASARSGAGPKPRGLALAILALVGLASGSAGCGEQKTIYVEDPSLAPAATGGAGTGAGAGGAGTSNPGPRAPAVQIAGWVPSYSSASGRQAIEWAGDAIDEVNPTWYSALADGTLKRRGGARDTAFVQEMHQRGYDVIPMIDDFEPGDPARAIMASATLRATHIAAILAEVDGYGYDGVDIDYENLAASSRSGFTAFMTDLAAALHARGKVLTAAVWSKTSEPGTGVSASQDWPALGQVVDRFKIMTYGYGWSGGPVRPIGPVWRAESILRFATSVMDPARVYYAIPFFGYRWPSTGANAVAVTYQQAETLRAQHGATATFDAYHGEATFAYTDAQGVSWTVWYQTPEAIEAKLELAKLVGVGGVAIWRLGGEAESFWQTIRQERVP